MFKSGKVLIKLSGEALSNGKGFGFDDDFIEAVCGDIKDILSRGVKVSLVVGGGNFFRGRTSGDMERATADTIGMLATVMNALYLKDAFIKMGVKTVVLSALNMEVCEYFTVNEAEKCLDDGYLVIFAGGTGSPYFSTDTAAALRAAEIKADLMLFAKNVDGIYNCDPKTDKTATRFDEISYMDIVKNNLKAMDLTAATMCMENNIPTFCFKLEKGSIKKALDGDIKGTWIK